MIIVTHRMSREAIFRATIKIHSIHHKNPSMVKARCNRQRCNRITKRQMYVLYIGLYCTMAYLGTLGHPQGREGRSRLRTPSAHFFLSQ